MLTEVGIISMIRLNYGQYNFALKIREILRGKGVLGLSKAARSIEERNLNSVKLMEAAQVNSDLKTHY